LPVLKVACYVPKKRGSTATIDIRPEPEQFVREEIRNGHLHPASAGAVPPQPLSEFFRQSPLVGLGLNLERDRDPGRDLSL